jgi:membrane-bound lytic murein transglycosylase B
MLMKRTLVLSIGMMLMASCPAFAQPPHSQRRSDDRAVLSIAARMYGFDPELLMAIARVESNDNPGVTSPKGAQGLMQLMPATAAQYGVSDPFDPVDNALGAARFLNHLRGWQLSHPQMSLPEMLAAYNAGEGAVERYEGVPPYAETQEYVRRVLLVYLLDDTKPPVPRGQVGVAEHASHPARLTNTVRANSSNFHPRNFDSHALDQLQDIKYRRSVALAQHQ